MATAPAPPGCDPFFWRYFDECLRGPRDYAGFSVSLLSIALWMVAQLPQFYKNYQTKTVEALSPWFLAQWLLGDTGNILGCLLTGDQQQTTTYTAMYFVVADIVLMMQYVYYGSLTRRRERVFRYYERRRGGGGGVHKSRGGDGQHQRHGHRHRRAAADEPGGSGSGDGEAGEEAGGRQGLGGPRTSVGRGVLVKAAGVAACTGAALMLGAALHATDAAGTALVTMRRTLQELRARRPAWVKRAGQVCGYTSMVLYLSSRLPQIHKNWSRKSVEGLALLMFLVAVLANCAYGAGILLRARSWAALLRQAPWIVGSLGTVALDSTILLQFLLYAGQKRPAARAARAEGRDEPLLRQL